MPKPVSFLMRIIRLLGHGSLLDLTLASGISYDALAAIEKGSRGQSEAMDDSETWQAVSDHVTQRLGELMAAREELQRKLDTDRRKRLHRREQIQCR